MRARAALRALVGALAGSLSFAAPQAQACALALVLAQDVSSSVDAMEFRLQQQGAATALTDPDVMAAIEGLGGVWLTSFEWSGRNQQVDHLDWTFLRDPASIRAAAARIAAAARAHDDFPTALGYALGHGVIRLRRAPETCARQVIDVSGDGVTNAGFMPRHAYAANDMRGITVNALVIESAGNESPVSYFRDNVIFGPGAFIEIADGYGDYARAMRRKLLREIGFVGVAALDAPRRAD